MKSVILYQILPTTFIILLIYIKFRWKPFAVSMPDYLMAIGLILLMAGTDIIIYTVKRNAVKDGIHAGYDQCKKDVQDLIDSLEKADKKPVDNIKGI